MRYVFDIETNGLYESVTTVHCLSICPLEGSRKAIESFSDTSIPGVAGTILEGLQKLSEASELTGHNIVGYDLPVLKKLYDWEPSKDTIIFDTYVASRVFNPDRPRPSSATGSIGSHGLEAWGHRVGTPKPPYKEWGVFDPAMLRRNRADVEINHSVYHLLKAEAIDHDWKEALEIEHAVQEIIFRQEINGVQFNVKLAEQYVNDLESRIANISDELLTVLPVRFKSWGVPVSQPFKTNGHLKKMVTDWYPDFANDPNDGSGHIGGPFTRIEIIPFNLNSQTQLKEHLLKQGWIPTEYNTDDNGNQTSPKLTEDSFGSIVGDFGRLIKERVLLSHRCNQISGWLERVRPDGTISAGANTCGTNTGRFRHSGVVNVPKAAKEVFFGKEMRSLFMAREGRVFVGHDASGLELRMLAHYMDDPEFSESVVNGVKEDGTDIHTRNKLAAALDTRDQAKSFIYAFLYGAGDEKIGQVVGGTESDGARLKRTFLKNIPSLARLIKRVKRASQRGFLVGLDGRKVWMRGSSHAALNTLLQSAGAVVMKKSIIILDEMVKLEGLDVVKVIDMHDEAQADVHPDHVERYKELAVQSIRLAGEHFKLKVPLDGEAKHGNNWADTH